MTDQLLIVIISQLKVLLKLVAQTQDSYDEISVFNDGIDESIESILRKDA